MNRLSLAVAAAVAAVTAVLTALLFAPAAPTLGGTHTGDAELAARTRNAIEDADGMRGLAVGSVDGGQVRLAGLGEATDGRPVDADTAFEPGSVTKTWTATLLADMIAKGEVRATDTLGALMPGRSFADPAVRDITLEELASHRSGLPRLAPREGAGLLVSGILVSGTAALRGADPYAGVGIDDVLGAVTAMKLEDAKGTVRYSNFGMSVLGYALAERAGTTYERLVTERVLTPLGMTDTVFRPDDATPPATAAAGSTAAGRPVDAWSGSGYLPAGIGDWTTAGDLTRFLAANMAGTAPGALPGALPGTTPGAATGTAATEPRFTEDDTTRIGYAWFTTRYGDREITWHNGATGGFSAWVGYEPATKRGVVVLGNTDRSVGPVGLALLGVTDGPGTTPEPESLLMVGLTIVLLLGALGPVGTLAVGGRIRWWPAPDRLRVVSGIVGSAGSLAVAHVLGAWVTLPGTVWAIVVGLVAGGATVAALRWTALPAIAAGKPTARWIGTAISIAIGAAIVTAAAVMG